MAVTDVEKIRLYTVRAWMQAWEKEESKKVTERSSILFNAKLEFNTLLRLVGLFAPAQPFATDKRRVFELIISAA